MRPRKNPTLNEVCAMKHETKTMLKLIAHILVCYAIVLAFGLRQDQQEWPWWRYLSVITSTYTLVGLSSGLLLLGRGIAKCCRASTKGWHMALDIILCGIYAAAIPYCLLWFVAECIWLRNFGFTHDPLFLSITVIIASLVAAMFAIEPDIYADAKDEHTEQKKTHPAILIVEWALVAVLACWTIIPFLAMQGRRNWTIVTKPETFAATQPTAAKFESVIHKTKPTTSEVLPMAGVITFPKVPKSAFADCESDLHQKINMLPATSSIAFSIDCNCYSNNAFRIWAGRDENGNGELELAEADVGFGWDAGVWMLENVENCEQAMFQSTMDNLRQRGEIRLAVDETRACLHIEYLINGTPIIPGGQLDKYRPSRRANWNIVRIVRNGVPEPDEVTTMTITGHVPAANPAAKRKD